MFAAATTLCRRPLFVPPTGSAYDGPAALPTSTIDTTYNAPVGGTDWVCGTAAEFTTALAGCARGDTITLTAGNTFTGTFTLGTKTGTGWVYIRSSALASLTEGVRVGANSTNKPIIVGAGSPVVAIQTSGAASHWRLAGLEIKCPTTPVTTGGIIRLGTGGETDENDLPHHIVIDRCYIHGDATIGGQRGVQMNSNTTAVIDCYITDFGKDDATDCQAIMSWNARGPFKIHNNRLEASGECVMFGGSQTMINNLVASDITITQNYFSKKLTWIGSSWAIKNLLEFKFGNRILVEANYFENCWVGSQIGAAFNYKSNGYGSTVPWALTSNVTTRYNWIAKCESGMQLSGVEEGATVPTNAICIHDNIFEVEDVSTGAVKQFSLNGGPDNILIQHNTVLLLNGGTCAGIGTVADSFNDIVIKDNITYAGNFGWKGDGTGEGTASFDFYFATYSFINNAIVGSSGTYPATNIKPANTAAVLFTNFASKDYTLQAGSPCHNTASDGGDMGCTVVTTVAGYKTTAING